MEKCMISGFKTSPLLAGFLITTPVFAKNIMLEIRTVDNKETIIVLELKTVFFK